MEAVIRSLTVGMTTALWKTIPTEIVEITELLPIQERGRPPTIHKGFSQDPALYCVEYKNNLYIEDGHNRYYRALDRGDLTILVRRYKVQLY